MKPNSAALALIGVFYLISGVVVGAQENPISDGNPQIVATIIVEGNRKTDEDVVRNLLPVQEGDRLGSTSAEDMRIALVDSDLFADVSVSVDEEREGGDITIRIQIDEKWTLIPIPFFSSDGSGFTGGLILIESNLLGRNKQLISGGFGGTSGFSGFFVYADPALFQSRWFGSLSAGTGLQEEERTAGDGSVIRTTSFLQQNGRASIGYSLTDDFDVSATTGLIQFRNIEDTLGSAADGPAITDTSLLGFTNEIGLRYDATIPEDVLRTGFESRAQVAMEWTTGEPSAEASASLGIPLFDGHRLRLLGSGGLGDMSPLLERVISGRDGYRTLPFGSASADRYGSLASVYDFPVWGGPWGALVLSHYWEVGTRTAESVDNELFWGPGGGFRVYLRQIAIPALGMDVAYNLEADNLVFSFSLGAQM